MVNELENKYFIILLSVFIGSITIASVLATKVISVFGFFVPAGIIAYSVTFICTDVIGEIWGAQTAKNTVLGGFIALLFVLALVQLSLFWPSAPFWKQQEAFQAIVGSTSRVIVASFVAYLLSQLHDVWAFHKLKRMTNDKHLWLRNCLSTGISQFIDSFIFIMIAFYGVMPAWPLIFGQWTIKLLIAVLDTPFVYYFVWMFKKKLALQTA